MVNAQLHGVLRHLGGLRDAQAFTEASDAQLLERFARGHEEAPFTALVRRHGPMVWGVSRRVLANVHDAEDVFQATFLLLARKAGSIRKAGSVGGWLHGVAHRLALQARLRQARRQSREKRAADRGQGSPGGETSLSEVQAALDAALGELPEKYRVVLVLCYLEGHTQEEAARHLGCPPATVRTRVARGRKLLRARLTKHGLTLSAAGLAALLIASAAPAAAPAALVKAAARAAAPFAAGQPAAALCSARAAGLVEGGLRATSLGKAKAAVLLLAAGLVAGAAALAGGQRTEDFVRATEDRGQRTEGRGPSGAAAGAKAPVVEDKHTVAYGGRVLGPDGKPVAGAKLYLTGAVVHQNRPSPSPEYATTGRDGRFRFSVPKARFGDQFTRVAAAAAGYGAGWVEVSPVGKRDGLTLRLVKDDVPITGQVVDLEGKPVAGATLTVLLISAATGEDLDTWLEAARAGKVRKDRSLNPYKMPWSPRVTTDARGRFRLGGVGIGRNRLVRARLDGPTIASQYLTILTRPGKTIAVKEYKGQPGVTTCHGADFRHVAAPSKPVVGVVRDKDTKKPLAGFTIESNRLANDDTPGNNITRTTTDARGRYRLTGLPKGKGNRVRLVPPGNLPYLSVHGLVPDSAGLDPVTVDFELKRGIWVEGKLTDKVTGKPVQGHVDYFALHDNPNLRDYPGFHGTVPSFAGVKTKEDGSYRVAGLPGPGLIVVYQTGHHLRAPERDDGYKLSGDSPLFTSPYQLAPAINYTAAARVHAARGVASVRCDVTLDPGWAFTGKLLGPDGKPLAGALGFGLNDRFPPWNPEGIKGAEFAVRKFNPRGPRDVLFLHREKGLVGVAPPPKENGGSVTVRLGPGATVTGRLVDGDGKPRAGVELEVAFRPKREPAWWGDYSPAHARTDREGRFRLGALLPGYEFRLSDGRGALSFGAPRPGRTSDLGDVRMERAGE